MHTLFVLAAIAILPSDPATADPKLSADEILQKSDAAYAAVKTYVGATTVSSSADFGGRKLDQVSIAKVTFARPGKLRIEGMTATNTATGIGGHPFAVISDGRTTWRALAITNNGAFAPVDNLAMAGLGGVAHGAAEGIPAALMKSDGAWTGGHDPFVVARLSPPELAGQEKIDGADCYKLVTKAGTHGDVTWWIDSKTFFLRQMTRHYNETQMAQQAKAAEEALKKIGQPPAANMSQIKSKSDTFTFTIDQLNGPVDAKLFDKPTTNLLLNN